MAAAGQSPLPTTQDHTNPRSDNKTMAVLGGLSLAAASMSSGLAAGEITTALKVHKEAFQQDKRFFYAGYTEAVAHHGEAYAQAERLHAQSYSQGEAAYYQAEKHHRRSFQQARLQHKIDRDIAMRSEIRSGLRDEFGQKVSRNHWPSLRRRPHI